MKKHGIKKIKIYAAFSMLLTILIAVSFWIYAKGNPVEEFSEDNKAKSFLTNEKNSLEEIHEAIPGYSEFDINLLSPSFIDKIDFESIFNRCESSENISTFKEVIKIVFKDNIDLYVLNHLLTFVYFITDSLNEISSLKIIEKHGNTNVMNDIKLFNIQREKEQQNNLLSETDTVIKRMCEEDIGGITLKDFVLSVIIIFECIDECKNYNTLKYLEKYFEMSDDSVKELAFIREYQQKVNEIKEILNKSN